MAVVTPAGSAVPTRRRAAHRGQVVAVQAAALAVLVAATAGAVPLVLVAPPALAVVVLATARIRGRWAYRWLALAVGYRLRRRVLAADAPPDGLLALAHPHCATGSILLDGAEVAVVTDAGGPTAMLAVGDGTAVLARSGAVLPALAGLLPAPGAGQPVVRLRLVSTVVPAPGPAAGGPPATAYRQLTGGVPAYRRVLLGVQVRRDEGWDEASLRRALGSAVRRIRRRLLRAGLPAEPLGPGALAAVLAEVAHADPAGPTVESWSGLSTGGCHQSTFVLPGARLHSAPAAPTPGGVVPASLAARLLALPGCAVTLALAAEADATEATVRLAAAGPAELAAAVDAMRRQLDPDGVACRRQDGAQLAGLRATLPLGGPDPLRRPTTSAGADPPPPPAAAPPGAVGTDLAVDDAGVLLGANRRGEPVLVRLFRPLPTRVVTVGPTRRVQLVVLRALATGARLYLQTDRPGGWEAFLRAVDGPGGTVTLAAPGHGFDPPPASLLRPQLVVVDAAGGRLPVREAPWRTVLVVRERLAPVDVDLLARAHLALLPPLAQTEAVLAGAAVGLGDLAAWLTRIRGDMVGAVVPRRMVRWALAVPTDPERQILGPDAGR